MDDEKIIGLFFERSEQAVKELSAKYGKLIFHISHHILNDNEDARECENDTYLGVWNTVPPKKPNPFAAYVCKIARNISLNKRRFNRAKKRDSSFDKAMEELDDCFSVSSAETEWFAREMGRVVNDFVRALEHEERVLFLRRYWFSHPVTLIANDLHMSENNVSVKLFRIREKLKMYLGEEGFSI